MPRIVPDRDQYRKWYLDEPVTHTLHNGDTLHIDKGFRFDGHSSKVVVRYFIVTALFTFLLWFFPEQVLSVLKFVTGILAVSSLLVITVFKAFGSDIKAALIHDALVDLSPWHRYNRRFIDREYTELMKRHSYGLRRWAMPKAVRLYGYLVFDLWGDYRGIPKPNTVITVSVKSDVLQ